MHHRTIEKLAAGKSPVHRLDPRAKLFACLAFVVCVAVMPPWPLSSYLPFALLVLVALVFTGLPWGFVLRRTLTVLPFVALVAVFLPFTRGSDALVSWPSAGISVYREGLQMCLAILAKGLLAILGVCWLVFTTPFHRLLLALRWFRSPKVVLVALAFLFRYLDLLADEALRVRRARAARSPGGTRRWRGRSTGGMIGSLLLRTVGRSERIHSAMLARGYDGEVRTLERLEWRRTDLAFLICYALLLAVVVPTSQLIG